MRLGVAAALVAGELVRGDVAVDEHGCIAAVGVAPAGGSAIAVPGLVDLQVNGVAGVDLRVADRDGCALAADTLARHGATAVQPTLHSQSLSAHRDSLGRLAGVILDPPPGCRFLPAHLEGPFLSRRRCGAHDDEHLLAPDDDVLDELLGAGPVGMMTLAPELDGALSSVERLCAAGVVVSLGHTDATAEEMRAAVAAGARHVTHVWNAQRPIAARDPGPIGVALSEPLLTVGLIADLVHVSAEVVTLTAAAARGRLAATTDSVATTLDTGQPVGAVRRSDGTLAGGVALPDESLRNLVSVGLSLAEAADACGGAQRRLLGMAPVRLEPGERAEVVVLTDGLLPERTVIGTDVFDPA